MAWFAPWPPAGVVLQAASPTITERAVFHFDDSFKDKTRRALDFEDFLAEVFSICFRISLGLGQRNVVVEVLKDEPEDDSAFPGETNHCLVLSVDSEAFARGDAVGETLGDGSGRFLYLIDKAELVEDTQPIGLQANTSTSIRIERIACFQEDIVDSKLLAHQCQSDVCNSASNDDDLGMLLGDSHSRLSMC
ncbi:hypothetical protein HG530_002798 [Fusarium avenaceum]|nr:hypothetical protein HG530_002798 [Fusarium avenaceum]